MPPAFALMRAGAVAGLQGGVSTRVLPRFLTERPSLLPHPSSVVLRMVEPLRQFTCGSSVAAAAATAATAVQRQQQQMNAFTPCQERFLQLHCGSSTCLLAVNGP
jgi:hypothetical protein